MDDATRRMDLPPALRAAVSPAISALRWGALGYGIVFSAPSAFRGSYAAVAATAVCLFVTTWRTIIPVRLGSDELVHELAPVLDLTVLGVAIGYDGGVQSPYLFCLLAALVVVAFGWGWLRGAAGLGVALAALVVGTAVGATSLVDQVDGQRDLAAILTLVLATAAAAYVRTRLVDAEGRRARLAGEVEHLSEANDLLTLLNTVARTLPSSLTLREALDRSREQIHGSFDARVICLLTYDDHAEDWVPKLADGCTLRPSYLRADLPAPLAEALAGSGALLVRDLTDRQETPIGRGSGSGMYLRLEARGETIGLLGVEHPTIDHYDEHSLRLLEGLSEVLALTVDNARWFGRLRSLGAQEERVRIARDLHDRLGQWLTYISMELERILAAEPQRSEELDHLQGDVQAALDELRETLRQLRSGVTEDKPLAVVAHEMVNRFAERADVAATLTVVHPEDRLPVPVENELLRILQEALSNVDKHAKADHVDVVWDVRGGNFELVVHDDGRGFETARGVRDSAYGLVGMRERADVIGARLEIDSRPRHGTTIRVAAGTDDQPTEHTGTARSAQDRPDTNQEVAP
jgi:signal transduction histidine kinase